MNLRPYQKEMVRETYSAMRNGHRGVVCQAATGSGKTVIAAHMLYEASSAGKRCMFINHRRELLAQSSAKLGAMEVDHGFIASGVDRDLSKDVQVCSIRTLVRRLDRVWEPDFVFYDEAHHMGASEWDRVYQTWRSARHVLLTATPRRMDGKGLGRWASHMVQGPSVRSLIEEGSLCDYKLYAPFRPDLKGIKTARGDYIKGQLSDVMNSGAVIGSAVDSYTRLSKGKQSVVFCVGVEHSKSTAAAFSEAGYKAEHLDGSSPKAVRDSTMQKFRDKEIDILTNCDLFGEGLDVPGIHTIILLRPTKSLSLYLQQIGRGMRPFEGKEKALILDHAGNCILHGLPCTNHAWSLEDSDAKNSRKQEEAVRVCPDCFAALEPRENPCPECGHVFSPEPREIKTEEGLMLEVDVAAEKQERKQERAQARSLKDLVELGKQRGYRPGWAYHVFKSRQGKRS